MSQGFVNCKSLYRVNVSKSTSTLQVPLPKVKADRRPRSQTGMELEWGGRKGRQAWETERGINKRKGVNQAPSSTPTLPHRPPPKLEHCVQT